MWSFTLPWLGITYVKFVLVTRYLVCVIQVFYYLEHGECTPGVMVDLFKGEVYVLA